MELTLILILFGLVFSLLAWSMWKFISMIHIGNYRFTPEDLESFKALTAKMGMVPAQAINWMYENKSELLKALVNYDRIKLLRFWCDFGTLTAEEIVAEALAQHKEDVFMTFIQDVMPESLRDSLLQDARRITKNLKAFEARLFQILPAVARSRKQEGH